MEVLLGIGIGYLLLRGFPSVQIKLADNYQPSKVTEVKPKNVGESILDGISSIGRIF